VKEKPKLNPTKEEAVDVPADDPVGTMMRFSDGLKRILRLPKTASRVQGVRDHRVRLKI